MLVIGTRGSDLALTQTHLVRRALAAHGVAARLEVIRTQGDRQQHLSLSKLEGKGFFTAELEEALASGGVDLAVHSLKDLPTQGPPGLTIGAVAGREDPRDVLIVRREIYANDAPILPLPLGARVGTSSIRRQRLLEVLRPDLEVVAIRGNVGTRLGRLDAPQAGQRLDAVVLAQAGLNRLGLLGLEHRAFIMPAELFVPAPAQGALAVQVRADDAATCAAVALLHDPVAAAASAAERAVLQALGGGCHAPLGAYAHRTSAAADGADQADDPDRRWHIEVFWQPDPTTPPARASLWAARADQLAGRVLKRLGGDGDGDGDDGGGGGDGRGDGRSQRRPVHGLVAPEAAPSAARPAAPAAPAAARRCPPPRPAAERPQGPLVGRHIVLTRQPLDGSAWAEAIANAGGRVSVVPCIERALLPLTLPRRQALAQGLASAGWLALASQHAVQALASACAACDLQLPAHLRLAAVGPTTAAVAAALFGRPCQVASPHSGAGLAAWLLAQPDIAVRPVLLPQAEAARRELPEALAAAGVDVRAVALYATSVPAAPLPAAEQLGRVDVVVFASPSAVSGWLGRGPLPSTAQLLAWGPHHR